MRGELTLGTVDKDLFERVWGVLKQFDAREHHFNDLQSRYRALASTWLLAAFGGVGFVLSKEPPPFVGRELLAMAIALAGAVGILLLWVLDVLVYHDLLIASYVTGRELERNFPWLPPVRSRVSELTRGWALRWYIAAFYIAGIAVLCVLAAVIAWIGASKSWSIVSLLVGAGLTLVVAAFTLRSIRRKEALTPWPIPEPQASER